MSISNKLTDLLIKKSLPADRPYKLSDGGGLFLLVHPNGSRYWRMAYRFGGKQKLLALGVYPGVSLASARSARDIAKRSLLDGEDPGAIRRQEKQFEKGQPEKYFRHMALSWLENYAARWSAVHRGRVLASFEADIFPALGNLEIEEITPPMVLDVVRAVEARGALDVASRILQRISAVFRYAIQTGRVTHNPAADMRGVLKTRKVIHRHALSRADLPEFFTRLVDYDGEPVTKLALLLVVLTFVRTGELRGARWDEFDLSSLEWRLPASRMKMKAAHVVHLSSQAVVVLDALRSYTGNQSLLFPSRLSPERPFSENTMLFALYRMGYHGQATTHGFRALASTILNESGFKPDVIERQLAHVERNKVRAAYHRSEYLDDRRRMMEWWGDYLENAGLVIPGGA